MPRSSNRTILILIAAALLVLGVGAYIVFGIPAQERGAAQNLVEDFGAQLQKVSLLDPNASSTMAEAYSPYVQEALLAQWQRDPESAPGRLTSSPWPAAIVVDSMSKQGSGYVVSGRVALETSTGSAGQSPVVILVVKEDGRWKIAAYQEPRSE
ncbi:MAG: hypothetical protein HYS26_01695 [Candidatus Kaiserbacteria bacterium]|nr:MAG: hypothetical protein HYS26_01695 [Candidatus Kaiserbacteria bacterium]